MEFTTIEGTGTGGGRGPREPAVKFYAHRDQFQFNTAARRELPERVEVRTNAEGFLLIVPSEGPKSRRIEQTQGVLSLTGTRAHTGWEGVKWWLLEPREDGWLGRPYEREQSVW